MESFNYGKKENLKKKTLVDKVSNFVKAALLSKLLNNSNMDQTLVDNLYANRILEEELISPNISFEGFEPELPKGSKVINVADAQFLQIDGRMYHINDSKEGFNLIDSTYDFMPRPTELYPSKTKLKNQKKYNVSDASTPIDGDQFYKFNKTEDSLDNWIIHNDDGQIKKNRLGKDSTWWLKGEPYK